MNKKLLPKWNTSSISDLRPFSRISLIVVDLDGTMILPNQTEISTFLRHKRSLEHYRVGITIATGRTLEGSIRFIQEFKMSKQQPLILYNGSVVLNNATLDPIYTQHISSESLIKTLKICRSLPVNIFAYYYIGEDSTDLWNANITNSREFVLGWTSKSDRPLKDSNGMNIHWQDESVVSSRINPSAVLVETFGDSNLVTTIQKNIGNLNDINITKSGNRYLEIRPKNSNKGIALSRVAGLLGIQREQVLALGDNDNDAEMLKWAGVGVAIAEASENALESCNYICNYGVFKGAVEVLRLVHHSKRYYDKGLI